MRVPSIRSDARLLATMSLEARSIRQVHDGVEYREGLGQSL